MRMNDGFIESKFSDIIHGDQFSFGDPMLYPIKLAMETGYDGVEFVVVYLDNHGKFKFLTRKDSIYSPSVWIHRR